MMKIYLSAVLLSFALSFLFTLGLIPLLRKLKAGQNILRYVTEHKSKSGTPTMGGIAFITAAVLSTAVLFPFVQVELLRTTILALVIGLSYMIIGFLDDYLKKRHKENLGLRAWQKFAFQSVVAIFCGVYCFRAELTELVLPFFRTTIDIGWGIIPLIAFVFLATVNAVNLTDGLDGLAAGTCTPFLCAIGVLILLQKRDEGLALLSFCLVGALLAYLAFNVSPASVFMGDTGSLALGGFIAAISSFSGNALFIPVIGVCFVLSVISVIVQVIYYKVTRGKRIFLMSPIHHHFQMKGYSESRISYLYFSVTLLLGLVCVLTAL